LSLAIFAIVAAGVMVPSAKASVCASTTDCTFNLNSTDVGAFGAGPFGTVELKLNGSAIDFTVDLADGFGFNLIDTGTHEAFSFNNVIGGTLALSSFSSSRTLILAPVQVPIPRSRHSPMPFRRLVPTGAGVESTCSAS
jgi:hypothetical protein